MLGLCRQFHCLPSQLYAEDAHLIGLLEIEQLGRRDDAEGGELT